MIYILYEKSLKIIIKALSFLNFLFRYLIKVLKFLIYSMSILFSSTISTGSITVITKMPENSFNEEPLQLTALQLVIRNNLKNHI